MTARHKKTPTAPGPKRIRVAVYLRISTDEKNQPFSLEAQEAKLRAFVASQDGWELACPPFTDQASGATTDRPQLQRALAAARAGKSEAAVDRYFAAFEAGDVAQAAARRGGGVEGARRAGAGRDTRARAPAPGVGCRPGCSGRRIVSAASPAH
jgi:hypothetical protein